MLDKRHYSKQTVIRQFRADLRKLAEGVKDCVDGITPTGLPEDAVAPLVRVAAGMPASLPELEPLTAGQSFSKDQLDAAANALLNGCNPEDGGGVGKALKSTPNGSCFFNAAATGAWGRHARRSSETDGLALPLRIAVILAGVRRLAEMDQDASSFFRRRDAYDGTVTDAANEKNLTMATTTPAGDIFTVTVSRALLSIALNTIVGELAEGSCFCMPLVAEALGVNMRFYLPVASLPAEGGGDMSVGGTFNKTVLSPPLSVGEAPPSCTIHIAMSMHLRGEALPFDNIHKFKDWIRTKPTDRNGVAYSSELNHFVPICPATNTNVDEDPHDDEEQEENNDKRSSDDDGGEHRPRSRGNKRKGTSTPQRGRVKQKSGRVRGAKSKKAKNRRRRWRGRGEGYGSSSDDDPAGNPCLRGRRSDSDVVWGRSMRAKQYVESFGAQADSAMDLGHGDKYDPTATRLLGGKHDMGTPADKLPECLLGDYEDGELDVDFSRRLLPVKELGKEYLREGLDSLCFETPQLREVDLPDNCLALNLGRGPGVLRCILQFSRDQMKDESLDREAELRGLRDRLFVHIQEISPAVPLQPSSLPSLMCRSFQTISGVALRKALEKEGIKYVYHYLWGMKAKLDDYEYLDEASVRAHAELAKEEEGFTSLLNLHDIARTVKTGAAGIPLVWSYTTGRGNPGRAPRGQPGCASMRTFAQMPGIWEAPSGSVQTRGRAVVQFENITKYTFYSLTDHVQRSAGKFTHSIGKTVNGVKNSVDWMRTFWDKSVAENLDTLKRIGRGLRMEARVQGKVTVSEAVATCQAQGVHDPTTAWRKLGQYQRAPHGDNPRAIFYPVRFVTPEVMAAHAIRVIDAASIVVKGRGIKASTEEMKHALVDVYACSGRTLKGLRCTDTRALVRDNRNFWVFNAEAGQRPQLSRLPPTRTLPARVSQQAQSTAAPEVRPESDVPAGPGTTLAQEDSDAHLSSIEENGDDDRFDNYDEGPGPGFATWEVTAIGDLQERQKRRRLGEGSDRGHEDDIEDDGLNGMDSDGDVEYDPAASFMNRWCINGDVGLGSACEQNSGGVAGGSDGENRANLSVKRWCMNGDVGLGSACEQTSGSVAGGSDGENRVNLSGGGADADAGDAGGDDDGSGGVTGDVGGSAGDDGAYLRDSSAGTGSGGDGCGDDGGGACRPAVDGGDGIGAVSGGDGGGSGEDDGGAIRSGGAKDGADGTGAGGSGDGGGNDDAGGGGSDGGGCAPARGGARGSGGVQRDAEGSSSRRRSQRFGLSAADHPEANTRFTRTRRPSSEGRSSAREPETSRKEVAIQRMRASVSIRKKYQFGTRGLTWSTKASLNIYGRCGSGPLCADEEAVYQAIWEKYGERWGHFVSCQ